jgi:hypothetical protein
VLEFLEALQSMKDAPFKLLHISYVYTRPFIDYLPSFLKSPVWSLRQKNRIETLVFFQGCPKRRLKEPQLTPEIDSYKTAMGFGVVTCHVYSSIVVLTVKSFWYNVGVGRNIQYLCYPFGDKA